MFWTGASQLDHWKRWRKRRITAERWVLNATVFYSISQPRKFCLVHRHAHNCVIHIWQETCVAGKFQWQTRFCHIAWAVPLRNTYCTIILTRNPVYCGRIQNIRFDVGLFWTNSRILLQSMRVLKIHGFTAGSDHWGYTVTNANQFSFYTI